MEHSDTKREMLYILKTLNGAIELTEEPLQQYVPLCDVNTTAS